MLLSACGAVAHLLPVLNSSCFCFLAPKQGPDSGPKECAGPQPQKWARSAAQALAAQHASLQALFKSSTLAIVLKVLQIPDVLLNLDKAHNPLYLPAETTSELSKVVRGFDVLVFSCVFTWTCASQHNAVHFLHVSISKSGPRMVWIAQTWKCATPRRHAFYQHLNFRKIQKLSEPSTTCSVHSYFGTCFTAQQRAFFLISPDGSAPAIASLLLIPPEPQNRTKKAVFRAFFTFSHTCIFFLRALLVFFLLVFSFLWLFPPFFFHLAIASEV